MVKAKQHISDLAAILTRLPNAGVIVSPGSRNAPLIRAFKQQGAKLFSVVDERSAAYVALGMAIKTQTPVILICTSGTAALNYAPAVSEAFFLGVPLIVLTADRPPEAIHQNENQTIFQENIYTPNCKKFYALVCEPDTEVRLKEVHQQIIHAYSLACSGFKGPIHINVPLREPLYNELPTISILPELTVKAKQKTILANANIVLEDNSANILIVVGQLAVDNKIQEQINKLATKNCVIVAEPIANIKNSIACADFICTHQSTPDIVILLGGHIVSKRLINYVRLLKNSTFYYISENKRITHPFGIECIRVESSANWLEKLNELLEVQPDEYSSKWTEDFQKWKNFRDECISNLPFSDLKIAYQLAGQISDNSILFLGNSSVIRYMQYFDLNSTEIYANRGTSGIDGCLSTAAGIALSTKKMVIAIVGDISFLYDSNALWNEKLPSNLKIIVINNGGGGIFKLINSPDKISDILPYQETRQNVNIALMCKAFDVDYYYANNETEVIDGFKKLTNKAKNTALLEIDTSAQENDVIFKEFLEKNKNYDKQKVEKNKRIRRN